MSKSSSVATHAPATVVQPSVKHTHTFVLLHGLGNNGDKYGSELLETAITSHGQKLTSVFPSAKFIFPNALWRRSSGFNRVRITQWFDIYSVLEPSQRNELQLEGLAESFGYIRSIIMEEIKLIPESQIILGGLSQGCAMSLFILLGLDVQLGAYFGMSGWLPFASDISESAKDGNTFFEGSLDDLSENEPPALKAQSFVRELLLSEGVELGQYSKRNSLKTPIFLGHGAKDEKVRVYFGEEAVATLRLLDFNVSWKCYPDLGHWYQIPEEIDDILDFLKNTPTFLTDDV